MRPEADFYAVLVGPSDYTETARSVGASDDAYDLQGPPNDLVLWGALLDRMNVPQGNRRVVGRRTGRVTGQAIERAVAWLEAKLRERPTARGLLVWSGHGATGPDGELLLCPEDTVLRAGALENTLSYDTWNERWGAGEPLALTVILDTCHAGASSGPTPSDRLRSLIAWSPVPGRQRVGDAVPTVCSCLPDQASYELEAGDRVVGALSFAAVTVLRRWGFAGPHQPYVPLSYADLLDRCRQLLSALELEQTPYFSGPLSDRDTMVLAGRDSTRPGRDPEDDGGKQLRPDIYDIMDREGIQSLGSLFITGEQDPPGPFAAEFVYWHFATADPFVHGSGFSLQVSNRSSPGFPASQAAFTYPNAPFTSNAPAAVTGEMWFDWIRWTQEGPTQMGWLAATSTPHGYGLIWITAQADDGELIELAENERFVFEKRADPPVVPSQSLFAIDEPVA